MKYGSKETGNSSWHGLVEVRKRYCSFAIWAVMGTGCCINSCSRQSCPPPSDPHRTNQPPPYPLTRTQLLANISPTMLLTMHIVAYRHSCALHLLHSIEISVVIQKLWDESKRTRCLSWCPLTFEPDIFLKSSKHRKNPDCGLVD